MANVVCLVLLHAAAGAQTGYFGSSQININPNTDIRLSGYGFRGTLPESMGILQDIFAQAMAFGIGPETSLLINVDATGVPDTITDIVAANLSAQYGIAPERIAITSTHTHSAPHIDGYLENLWDPNTERALSASEAAHIDQYTAEITTWLGQVAGEALASRTPGHQLAWGQGSVEFATNRRGEPNVDHDLPVMLVTDASGTAKAVLTSYATHAVLVTDNLVSGDWPGFAREAIEELYPEAIAMVMIGAAGDSNPAGAFNATTAQSHGQTIAHEVQRIINNNLRQPVSADITAQHGEVKLPYVQSAPDADYGITSWTFGNDLAMLFMEGEVVSGYSLRLKSELNGSNSPRLWVNAYANDVQGYIPTEAVLNAGGYEADESQYWYAQPGRYANGLEQIIVNEVHRQLDPFFENQNVLQLVVDLVAGQLRLWNPTGDVIEFDAYSIVSATQRLDPVNWTSLQQQGIGDWDEADNSDEGRLTEFNPLASTTLQPGESLDLGAAIDIPPPIAFGAPIELPANELTWSYLSSTGGEESGAVRIVGGDSNNLVLAIDGSTGQAEIRNTSRYFDVAIEAYTIASSAGVLLAGDGNWNSLADQSLEGWDEADNADAHRLTEFNPTRDTLLSIGGEALALGRAFDVSHPGFSAADLTFEFAAVGGITLTGVIDITDFTLLPGDYDLNGVVDQGDYQLWRNTYGNPVAAGAGADGNGDGIVNSADYTVWRDHNWSLALASGVQHQIPEPSAWTITLIGFVSWLSRSGLRQYCS